MLYKNIPYEKLSAHYWLITQNQLMKKSHKSYIHSLKQCIAGLWYNFKYNVIGLPIIWYTSIKNGLYVNAGKLPDNLNNMMWIKHTLIKGKYTQTKI